MKRWIAKGKIWLTIATLLAIPWLAYVKWIPSELKTNQNLFTIIGLFISYYTLIATVGIALYIYYLQSNAERHKANSHQIKVQRLIGNEIISLLTNLVFKKNPEQAVTIDNLKSYYIDNSLTLKESLPPQEYELLNKTVNVLMSSTSRLDYAFIFKPWLEDILKSDYWYLFNKASDFSLLYNKPFFSLLKSLTDLEGEYQENITTIHDKNGHILFMQDSEGISIFEDKELKAKGTFGYDKDNDYRIMNGYLTTKEYVGCVKNGIRDGYGRTYDDFEILLEEGIYENDQLVKGIEFNWIIEYKNRKPHRVFQYDADSRYEFSKSLEDITLRDYRNCKVADMEIDHGKYHYTNFRNFEQFFKEKATDY